MDCPCRVLYEGKDQLKQGWYVIETTPYSRSASLSAGGAPTAHRVFLMYRRALDSQGLHTLGVTDIALLLPSKGEVAPHTFCRVDKNLNTGMVRTRRPRRTRRCFSPGSVVVVVKLMIDSQTVNASEEMNILNCLSEFNFYNIYTQFCMLLEMKLNSLPPNVSQ